MKPAIFHIVLLLLLLKANGQVREPSIEMPPSYYQLQTDKDRMSFLMKAVSDSLNADRLSSIYQMSKTGLALAHKNSVDTMKGIFYFDLGKVFMYAYGKPDSAIYYFQKAIPYFPDQLSYYNLIAMREITICHLNAGRKDSAFAYLDSLHIRIDTMDIGNPRRYGISTAMATAYQYYGMFKTAIALYRNAIDGMRKAGNTNGVGFPLANLAELYDESEDDINAIKNARQALDLLKGNNMPFMGTAANLSGYYLNLNHSDSALYFLHLADSVGKLIHNDEQLHCRSPLIYSSILANQKKYDKAKIALEQVNLWLQKNPNTGSLINYLLQSANIDTALHRWAPAAATLQNALTEARKTGQQVIIVLVLQELATVYGNLKQYEKAFAFQKEFIERKDSLTNDETKSRLADFEAMNKTRQKEIQIALLKKTNDIKDLEIKNSNQRNLLFLGAFIFLLAGSGVFFYQRNRRLKFQSQKSKAELQMQVFRSQMNPHFIFNSLNGIEYFILHNEKRQASVYLNKFAQLIRIILSNSRKDLTPFAEDMQTIGLYVDLELLRFNNNFRYITDIEQTLLQSDYFVPPLLIQPFVENAIIHGFTYSDRSDLQLKISAVLKGEYIIYTIEDNGVGRAVSAAQNAVNKPSHTSMGMQITQQRIDIFNEQYKAESNVEIEDLTDHSGKPCGTRVVLKIKTA